jgi:hypothetical protein
MTAIVRLDSEDSILLGSYSKPEKKNQGMQAMNWNTRVENGVYPVRRGGANNSLFNRIGGHTINHAVLIADIDRTPINLAPHVPPRPHMYSRRFDNDPGIERRAPNAALADWRLPVRHFMFAPLSICAFHTISLPVHISRRRCAYSQTANARPSRLRRCRLLRFLLAGRFPLR